MGLLDAFADPQFRKDVVRGLLDAGNRGAVAGLLGGPVDTAALALGLLGYKNDAPVGGSEWIGQKMQNAGFVSPERNRLAEALAGVAIPAAANRLAPTLFAAEQKAAQNLAAPNRMNAATRGQAGAIVWHGSPHKFDKFDSSKIGTGEGAQAYGHGLYLAESPDVAGSYAQSVKANTGELIKRGAAHGLPEDVASNLASALQSGKNFDPLLDSARKMIDNPLVPAPQRQAAQRLLDNEMPAYNAWSEWSKPGQVYKVDLPDDQIARMLDWDKPLSQQPQAVQAWLKDPYNPYKAQLTAKDVGGNEPTGSLIMNRLQELMSEGKKSDAFTNQANYGAANASREIGDFGIPGIRYLDGGSRGAGAGTSNYVVFPGNEDLLRILERNGVPLP